MPLPTLFDIYRTLFNIKKYLCLPLLAGMAVVVAAAEKPNIVFILADDVGTGDVKCFYPPSKVTTPNIDRMAGEGIRFMQAYAPGAVCSPSRYALVTGAYPCRGPLRSRSAKSSSPLSIGVDELTLPKFLQKQGYRTAHIGKWHLGFGEEGISNWAGEIKPGALEIGFDYHFALPSNHNDNFKTYVENHRLLWLKEGIENLPQKPTADQLTQIRYDDEVDTTLTAKAIGFMEENRDRPFFLYLALTATHTHITPHKDFRDTSPIGQLGDYINELDFHVGEIMDTLKRLGLDENTVIFFSSDNGGAPNDHNSAGKNLSLRDESFGVAEKAKKAKRTASLKHGHRTNGDLRGSKGSNYEGGFRVPFIVRWPGKVKAGSKSDQLITLSDILATTAGLLGQELPDSAGPDSFDLSPVILGKKIDGPIRNNAILQTGGGTLAFREGDWKLRYLKKTEWNNGQPALPKNDPALYNLATDPAETTNLFNQQPERASAMQARLLELLKKGRSTAPDNRSSANEGMVGVKVRPLDWSMLDGGCGDDELAATCEAVMASTQDGIGGDLLAKIAQFKRVDGLWDVGVVPGKHQKYGARGMGWAMEKCIRPLATTARTLGLAIRTGHYQADKAGASVAEIKASLPLLLRSIARDHRVNGGIGRDWWGDTWQSAMWAAQLAQAAWIIWEDLSPDDRTLVIHVLIHEADRFLDTAPPTSNEKSTLDTKGEENVWNAGCLLTASTMLGGHPHEQAWREQAIVYFLNAVATPHDLKSDLVVDGKPLSERLVGYCITKDYAVGNHGAYPHPGYTASSYLNSRGMVFCALAGVEPPEALLYNAAPIYRGFIDHKWSAPPYVAPGGTIYKPDGGIYWPVKKETERAGRFYKWFSQDVMAATFGFDRECSTKGATWAKLHGQLIVDAVSGRPTPVKLDAYRKGAFFKNALTCHLIRTLAVNRELAPVRSLSAK